MFPSPFALFGILSAYKSSQSSFSYKCQRNFKICFPPPKDLPPSPPSMFPSSPFALFAILSSYPILSSQSYLSYKCQSHIARCVIISLLYQSDCVLVVFVSVRKKTVSSFDHTKLVYKQITCWGGPLFNSQSLCSCCCRCQKSFHVLHTLLSL